MQHNPYVHGHWTAAKFVEFMEQVWEIHTSPTPEGGVILRESEWYRHWSDAIDSAKRLGAVRTGGTHCGDKNAHMFRFPADEGRAGVAISYDGAACRLSARRFGAQSQRRTTK